MTHPQAHSQDQEMGWIRGFQMWLTSEITQEMWDKSGLLGPSRPSGPGAQESGVHSVSCDAAVQAGLGPLNWVTCSRPRPGRQALDL